ncbi:hypothetical protein [Streptomyces pseudovenezuelae]|uniref:Chloride channel protein n=1 Tax=Streptomyces pseudovenezuelae TaxID=67350 RepID=A0ABT6LZD1_9ACTN|nr:hypothetical protein [Streptomyces pseudovenezuelae]MDH6221677.1 hypothetical protein [Streptomyces pseudovenezuelae]
MNPSPRTPRTWRERLTTVWKWIARRRRTALAQVLRGACYGAGTGAVGLIFMWAQHWL